MASYFAGLPPGHFKPTLTPIGLVTPIIENPLRLMHIPKAQSRFLVLSQTTHSRSL
jgi:hypothetical protein